MCTNIRTTDDSSKQDTVRAVARSAASFDATDVTVSDVSDLVPGSHESNVIECIADDAKRVVTLEALHELWGEIRGE